MRKIQVEQIISAVESLCIRSNIELPQDVRIALDKALEDEASFRS